MKDLTKEEQDMIERFRKEFKINYELNIDDEWPKEWINVKDIESFLLSEIRTAVERERERIKNKILEEYPEVEEEYKHLFNEDSIAMKKLYDSLK